MFREQINIVAAKSGFILKTCEKNMQDLNFVLCKCGTFAKTCCIHAKT